MARKRRREEESSSDEEEEEEVSEPEEEEDDEEEEDEDDEDENKQRNASNQDASTSNATSGILSAIRRTDHHEELTTSEELSTNSKNLTSKDKARLKRQQLQDETILKLVSKSKDKNAIAQRNSAKRKKEYEPYASGKPIARYVSVSGSSYLLIPDDHVLFPQKPTHVKKLNQN
jgi:DNA mismatch repair ATPase MutL